MKIYTDTIQIDREKFLNAKWHNDAASVVLFTFFAFDCVEGKMYEVDELAQRFNLKFLDTCVAISRLAASNEIKVENTGAKNRYKITFTSNIVK